MNRRCPVCSEGSVSGWRLVFIGQARCSHCNRRIGAHWLAAILAACLYAVVPLFAGLVVGQVTKSMPLGFAAAALALLAMAVFVAKLAPLQAKVSMLEP